MNWKHKKNDLRKAQRVFIETQSCWWRSEPQTLPDIVVTGKCFLSEVKRAQLDTNKSDLGNVFWVNCHGCCNNRMLLLFSPAVCHPFKLLGSNWLHRKNKTSLFFILLVLQLVKSTLCALTVHSRIVWLADWRCWLEPACPPWPSSESEYKYKLKCYYCSIEHSTRAVVIHLLVHLFVQMCVCARAGTCDVLEGLSVSEEIAQQMWLALHSFVSVLDGFINPYRSVPDGRCCGYDTESLIGAEVTFKLCRYALFLLFFFSMVPSQPSVLATQPGQNHPETVTSE